MDFEKNPLVNDISRCQREAKRWLALVAFTLAALLVAVCIDMMQPSPASREIANFLMIVSVMVIICSSFGIKQSDDHCKSVQYGLSVFEAMKKDLEGTQSELEDTQARLYETEKELEDTQSEKATLRKALQWFQSSCRDLLFDIEIAECEKVKLQRSFEACMSELEDTRNELASVCSTIDSILADFCQAKKNAKALQDKLDVIKCERDDLQGKLDSAYGMLRDEIVAADNALCGAEALQNKLNVAWRVAGKRLTELSKLQTVNSELRYKLVEARMGCEFFRDQYVKADARVAYAQQQIKDLKSAVEIRDNVIDSLLSDVVTRTKG